MLSVAFRNGTLARSHVRWAASARTWCPEIWPPPRTQGRAPQGLKRKTGEWARNPEPLLNRKQTRSCAKEEAFKYPHADLTTWSRFYSR